MDVGPQADGHVFGDDFYDASYCVAGLFGGVDFRDHAGGGIRVGAAYRRFFHGLPVNLIHPAAPPRPLWKLTWLWSAMLNAWRNRAATAPAATLAAVSRALARSKTLRTSSKPYFMAPARSAWPGRRRVMRFPRPSASGSSTASTAMADCQLTQSLFSRVMPMGLPRV